MTDERGSGISSGKVLDLVEIRNYRKGSESEGPPPAKGDPTGILDLINEDLGRANAAICRANLAGERYIEECRELGVMPKIQETPAAPGREIADRIPRSQKPDIELRPCPCGKTPEGLFITDHEGGSGKWKYVRGNCCGAWEIEYRSGYLKGVEDLRLAAFAWNQAPREGDEEPKYADVSDDTRQAAINALRRASAHARRTGVSLRHIRRLLRDLSPEDEEGL
jgi:hypothetical protein